jgi:hypothetical protein
MNEAKLSVESIFSSLVWYLNNQYSILNTISHEDSANYRHYWTGWSLFDRIPVK